MYSPGCAIDLSAIAQELPDDYKVTRIALLIIIIIHAHNLHACI